MHYSARGLCQRVIQNSGLIQLPRIGPGCSWHVLLSSTLICTGELTLRVFLSTNPDLSGALSFYLIALPYFRFFLAVHSLVNWRKGWKCSERLESGKVVQYIVYQSIRNPSGTQLSKEKVTIECGSLKSHFHFFKTLMKDFIFLEIRSNYPEYETLHDQNGNGCCKNSKLIKYSTVYSEVYSFQKVIIVTQWPNHHHNTIENVLYEVVMWPLVWKTWWTGSHGGNFVGDLLASFFVCFYVE